MELIPFLIFAFIAFKVFSSFTKTASKTGGSAKAMMRRLHEELEKAEKLQDEGSHIDRYRQKNPTQRGQERLQSKEKSPWGENGTVSPGARVATNYLQKKASAARKASHKNPKQTGRRGENVDQNRHRTDGWGERGDGGMFSGASMVVLLGVGAAIIFAFSLIPAN